MRFLERLENLIQGAIEGGTSAVLRQKLSPVEIENHLERAMRDGAQPSRGGRLAPNSFVVWLHPDVFRETIAGAEGYNRHCEFLLNQYASNQGYILLQQRISVVFDTDVSLGPRDARVDAGFDAPAPTAKQPHYQPEVDRGGGRAQTQVIHAVPDLAASSAWQLEMIRRRNPQQKFDIPLGESTVGRSRDCDIVLMDDRNTVSRQHATFSNNGNDLRVRDSGSKNGTKVNGNFVPYHVETLVTDGAEITFGECVVVVRLVRDQGGW